MTHRHGECDWKLGGMACVSHALPDIASQGWRHAGDRLVFGQTPEMADSLGLGASDPVNARAGLTVLHA